MVSFHANLSAQPSKNKQQKRISCLSGNYQTFKHRSSRFDHIIKKYSKRYGVSSALIKSVITAESCFNIHAVSPKGAEGLMQLMPMTAKRFGVLNSFDSDANIKGGTRYLKFLLSYFKNDFLDAIAAYNAGEGAVKKHKGIPPYKETRHYVSQVSTLYRYYSQGGSAHAFKKLRRGRYTKTFFIPKEMPKSRFSPYKNRSRNVLRGNCKNRTSTRLRQSTKVYSGNGVWQRIYTAKSGDTLSRVMTKTGVHKTKLREMNGLHSRVKLKKGQKLLVWECRK